MYFSEEQQCKFNAVIALPGAKERIAAHRERAQNCSVTETFKQFALHFFPKARCVRNLPYQDFKVIDADGVALANSAGSTSNAWGNVVIGLFAADSGKLS